MQELASLQLPMYGFSLRMDIRRNDVQLLICWSRTNRSSSCLNVFSATLAHKKALFHLRIVNCFSVVLVAKQHPEWKQGLLLLELTVLVLPRKNTVVVVSIWLEATARCSGPFRWPHSVLTWNRSWPSCRIGFQKSYDSLSSENQSRNIWKMDTETSTLAKSHEVCELMFWTPETFGRMA